jgi:hypothetical protein
MAQVDGLEKIPFKKKDWAIDLACDTHICCRQELFTTYTKLETPTRIKGAGEVGAISTGSVKIRLQKKDGSGTYFLALNNVLYSPEMPTSLLSVGRLHHQGALTYPTTDGCEIRHNQIIVATGTLLGSMYRLDVSHQDDAELLNPSDFTESPSAFLAKDYYAADTLKMWHQRLGHIGLSNVRKTVGLSYGIDLVDDDDD